MNLDEKDPGTIELILISDEPMTLVNRWYEGGNISEADHHWGMKEFTSTINEFITGQRSRLHNSAWEPI